MHPELLKLTLKSLLYGAGGYGIARLGRDAYRDFTEPPKKEPELPITLPETRIPKIAEVALGQVDPVTNLKHTQYGDFEQGSAKAVLYPILAAAAGGGAGFFGASALYEKMQRAKLDRDIAKQKQNYLNTLQQVNTKLGAETPCIDTLLTSMITKTGELLKEASNIFDGHPGGLAVAGDWAAQKTAPIKDVLSQWDLFNPEHWDKIKQYGPSPLETAKNFVGDTSKAVGAGISSGVKSLANEASRSDAWGVAKAVGILGLLGAGGATYAVSKNLDRKRREAEQQSSIPAQVNLYDPQGRPA